MAALRNKRGYLQDCLLDCDEDQLGAVFEKLQLVKDIEAYFKDNVRVLQDEDVNSDISIEYNDAIGKPSKVDPLRYDMGEKFVQAMMEVPELKVLLNSAADDLRSIDDPNKALKSIIEIIFNDIEFWESKGWKREVWSAINREEFVQYMLGDLNRFPQGMPEWDDQKEAAEQKEKHAIGELKTFTSQAFKSIYDINAQLERGLKTANGCGVNSLP